MTLTEEEAKKKWCPHVVASHTDPRRGFHPGQGPEEYRHGLHLCIASECMAWRWAHIRHFPEPANTGDLYPDNQGYLARKDGNDMKRLGYCGKAGAP